MKRYGGVTQLQSQFIAKFNTIDVNVLFLVIRYFQLNPLKSTLRLFSYIYRLQKQLNSSHECQTARYSQVE